MELGTSGSRRENAGVPGLVLAGVGEVVDVEELLGTEVVQDGLHLVEGDVPRCAGHRRERGGYGVLRAS